MRVFEGLGQKEENKNCFKPNFTSNENMLCLLFHLLCLSSATLFVCEVNYMFDEMSSFKSKYI